ncbi:hypothetical protein B0H10DRAFT_2219504 [Mycena sp. CBHHK59/15]|nr:hypothetical protein B0H10DRAFT_2219504 [Mycena sp. CBHHK59/15]
MKRNRSADIVGPILTSGHSARALRGALPAEAFATNAYLSRAAAPARSLRGLLAQRLVADVGEKRVLYLEYADANHILLVFPMFEPQREQPYDDIGKWVADVFSVREIYQ